MLYMNFESRKGVLGLCQNRGEMKGEKCAGRRQSKSGGSIFFFFFGICTFIE